ncbi:MAG: hypothetical protein E6I32_13350 [Chloroflexi bacterium]|nr:MAG: hypothetical protein E6I32_13350 [Chloroflexota bacterium]
MAVQTQDPPQAKRSGIRRGFTLITAIVCFGLLGYLLFQIVHQFVVPPPPHRLILLQDVPLPSGMPLLPDGSPSRTEEQSLAKGTDPRALAPGVQEDFDGFDFQAYDKDLNLLFVAHTGPTPDFVPGFDPKLDAPFDGHIIVFNTQLNKIVGRIAVPQVAGMIYVNDPSHGLDKVFAADAQDNYIAVIDPHTLKVTSMIQLQDNESPDAMVYDPDAGKLFVSDPGTAVNPITPDNPKGDNNTDRNNENIAVIDAVHDMLMMPPYINLGNIDLLPGENVRPADMLPLIADTRLGHAGKFIPKFGHDVGHAQYYNGFIYVTSQVLPDANNMDPFFLPPAGTGELFQINAANLQIVNEIDLPVTCSTPHGFAIDASQHTGYIACTDAASSNSGRNLFENLVRVDLGDPAAMKVIPTDPKQTRLQGGPDIVRIDKDPDPKSNIDVLFVACNAGISIFDITPNKFRKLGDEIVGKGTHTLAVDPDTQTVYLPIVIGGRPVLRIVRYNPNGQ